MPAESVQRPEVDFVVRGEAEATIVEFMRAIESLPPTARNPTQFVGPAREAGDSQWESTHFAHIKGLSYRDVNGQTMHNPPRPLAQNLDAIPFPAYHLCKIERYTN